MLHDRHVGRRAGLRRRRASARSAARGGRPRTGSPCPRAAGALIVGGVSAPFERRTGRRCREVKIDERVVRELQVVELLQDPADGLVEALDHGGVDRVALLAVAGLALVLRHEVGLRLAAGCGRRSAAGTGRTACPCCVSMNFSASAVRRSVRYSPSGASSRPGMHGRACS